MSDEKIKKINSVLPFFENNLKNCQLCPRNCGIDRSMGQKGYCKVSGLKIYTNFLHKGEEPIISGNNGSGTIFFSGCQVQCVYCQNFEFSANDVGEVYTPNELAYVMLQLEEQGAHNINLVSPTHMLSYIIPALKRALMQGLSIPIVYNCSGYENPEVIKSLDGIVDVYLTDFKYITSDTAKLYSSVADYPDLITNLIKIMSDQVYPMVLEDDLLKRGIIIRHLVLPGHSQESIQILSWIKENVPDAFVSVMSQYQPYYKADQYPEISKALSKVEYAPVVEHAEKLELNGWIQDEPDESLAGVYFKQGSSE